MVYYIKKVFYHRNSMIFALIFIIFFFISLSIINADSLFFKIEGDSVIFYNLFSISFSGKPTDFGHPDNRGISYSFGFISSDYIESAMIYKLADSPITNDKATEILDNFILGIENGTHFKMQNIVRYSKNDYIAIECNSTNNIHSMEYYKLIVFEEYLIILKIICLKIDFAFDSHFFDNIKILN